jgi:hypothetical protein
MGDLGKAATGSAGTRFALCVLLMAMLLRALVPSGWMPTNDLPSGASFIVICSSAGMKTILVDGNGKPIEEERSAHAPDSCAFGNAVAFGLPEAHHVFASLANVKAAPTVTPKRLAGVKSDPGHNRDPPVPS